MNQPNRTLSPLQKLQGDLRHFSSCARRYMKTEDVDPIVVAGLIKHLSGIAELLDTLKIVQDAIKDVETLRITPDAQNG